MMSRSETKRSSTGVDASSPAALPAEAAGSASPLDNAGLLADLVTVQMQLFEAVDRRLRAELDLLLIALLPLRYIDRTPDCRVQELADGLGLTVGGASKSVDRLERSGWVERAAHPTDRRSSILELTEAGKGMLAKGLAIAADETSQRLGRALDADQAVELGGMLRRLRVANADSQLDPPRR